MKVLQVSESDRIGGAGMAALRLNEVFNRNGIESTLLVSRKVSNETNIISPKSFLNKFIAKLTPHLYRFFGKRKFGTHKLTLNNKFSLPFFLNTVRKADYQVLHLHWVNYGFVSIADLVSINKPIVWTLHDLWLFTAGCHHPELCEGFKRQCEACPLISTVNGQKYLSHQFQEKMTMLNALKGKMIITVPSNWMLENLRMSTLLKGFRAVRVPNMINTETFKPIPKSEAKLRLNLDPNSKFLVFGASNPLGDKHKGFEFVELLLKNEKYSGYKLLLFGKSVVDENLIAPNRIVFFNEVKSDIDLALIYNSADVLLMPSSYESFGQVAAEGMACGIPVLCFKTSGLLDIVEHKKHGYLAEMGDIEDYSVGLDWILNEATESDFSMPCREKIVSEFSPEAICQQFNVIYESSILNAAEN